MEVNGILQFSRKSSKKRVVGLLKDFGNKTIHPLIWLVIGNLNDMLSDFDKKGIHKHPQSLSDGFKKTVEDCGLSDLDLVGGNFTWEKSK